jgi:hypothetical protein
MVNQQQKQPLLLDNVLALQKKEQDARRKQLLWADGAICINQIN